MKRTDKRVTSSPSEQTAFLRRKWERIVLRIGGAALVTFVGFYVWGLYLIRTAPLGGYNIVGFNYTDHPIYTFNVGNGWGGNIFAYGGGGSITCCVTLDRHAKTVKVTWTRSYTGEQFDKLSPYQQKHLPKFEKIVPLPVITNPSSGYIGAHFLPDGDVLLTYSEKLPNRIKKYGEWKDPLQ